ncbi:Uncharacterised protein [Candidatus Gugararchaeum adminiculabundum]|nr:Uncharacterised protein [Candidatus Gugararchaeum adminiculabundum]
MEKMKAQAGIEFLIMAGIMLVLFAFCVMIYVMENDEAANWNDALEADSICFRVSSAINSFASLGASDTNSTYWFSLPPYVNYKSYSVRVAGNAMLVTVDYGTGAVGCRLQTKNIANSTGSNVFIMATNATMKNNGGALVVS